MQCYVKLPGNLIQEISLPNGQLVHLEVCRIELVRNRTMVHLGLIFNLAIFKNELQLRFHAFSISTHVKL